MSTRMAPWYQNDSERRKILEEEALKLTKLQDMTYTPGQHLHRIRIRSQYPFVPTSSPIIGQS
ncbi:uncharacterized protein EAE98_003281 [Botrytis deweyae]|uniref:Uncharacterized protein n=1 Tax=Botrytis deweyae TaxID=2478750 RepID=A0ABQ7IT43_9HELO|nr:uncharacterized protein EAE98_003281 [Botrytis deweyae]KAF7933572.1 hypothetical protein EAE98_003281 [Botrytis deweyae]